MNQVEKWSWKMDWCKKSGLAPAHYINWNNAEEAYNKEHEQKWRAYYPILLKPLSPIVMVQA